MRAMAADFARRFPKVGARLLIEPDKCEDPHMERLIQAFAFLCAHVRQKLDDRFPEITEPLLDILYPHYNAPIPPMSVVTFDPHTLTPQSGFEIPRGTRLESHSEEDLPCTFSTGYPVTVWPIEVIFASLREPAKVVPNAKSEVRISLQSFDNLSVSSIEWKKLRFFLKGLHNSVYRLREEILNHACHVECEWLDAEGAKRSLEFGPDAITPVGFDEDELLLPYPRYSLSPYKMLFEYFAFPDRFLFFDINGLDTIKLHHLPDRMDICIYLDRVPLPDTIVDAETFCLYATPIINLFATTLPPIWFEPGKAEYLITPHTADSEGTEIFRITDVTSPGHGPTATDTVYQPFYSIGYREDTKKDIFWCQRRLPSSRMGDEGSDLFLSFVDENLSPVGLAEGNFVVAAYCTNRDRAARLLLGNPRGDFLLSDTGPVSRVVCLMKPTPSRRFKSGEERQWQIISHLSLNHMSVSKGGEGILREMLRLYDFDNSPLVKQLINSIVSVDSRRVARRIEQFLGVGVNITIEFNDENDAGTGIFLLASVLERFVCQYASAKSFTVLEAINSRTRERIKKWPPRWGTKALI